MSKYYFIFYKQLFNSKKVLVYTTIYNLPNLLRPININYILGATKMLTLETILKAAAALNNRNRDGSSRNSSSNTILTSTGTTYRDGHRRHSLALRLPYSANGTSSTRM